MIIAHNNGSSLDLNIFLSVSQEAERRKRIDQRGRKTANDILLEDAVFQKKYLDYFFRRKDFFFLDTYNDTPEESVSKIKAELLARGVLSCQ